MTKKIFIIAFVFSINTAFGQAAGSKAIDAELHEKERIAEVDTLVYLDSTFNFQITVPNWLQLKETNSIYIWGGTLPAVNGIENAIAIKSFKKERYESFKEFRKYIIEGVVFGQSPPWSNSHKSLGKKDLGKYKDIGEAYKAYWMRGNLIYHCQYILLETKTAYLWIDFTSTQETFDKNLGKFEEFLDGFKVINLIK